MMRMIIKNYFLKVSSFLIILLFLLNYCSNAYANQSNYQLNLTKLTKSNEVVKYNKTKWKETISKESMPNDWFGGEAQKEGAKSKTLYKIFFDRKKSSSELFFSFFEDYFSENVTLFFLSDPDFTKAIENEIDENYNTKYNVWIIYHEIWKYTTKDFGEEADHSNKKLYILQNPEDYNEILKDFNSWIDLINETLYYFNLTIPKVNKADFLWNLLLKDMVIATPNKQYITKLVDGLGLAKKIEISDNELIWERKGRDDYIVKIQFGDQGFQTLFLIEDNKGNTIYEIRGTDTRLMIFIIIAMNIAIITMILVVGIIRWKKVVSN
jgi:hypothetical protein